MKLELEKWKEFKVSRTEFQSGLLDIEQCKCGCAGDLEEGNEINYIGAKKNDNGFMKRVARVENLVSKGNGVMLICDGQGSVGYSNYMKDDFIGSTTTSIGYDSEINELRAMFIVTCLDLNRYKYSYGRKYRPSMNDAIIKLPIKYDQNASPLIDSNKKYSSDGFIPDWDFMENYIKSLKFKKIETENSQNEKIDLQIDTWEEFKVGDLFSEVYKAKAHTKEEVNEVERKNKGMHFVSRTDTNNGVDIIVEKQDLEGIEEGNCITIGDTTATVYYQNESFIAGDHMVVLRAEWLNLRRGLFIRTLFAKENIRYCYGRAYIMPLIKDTIFKLPIKRDSLGNPILDKNKKYSSRGFIPDWDFMEQYINSLPYSDKIK